MKNNVIKKPAAPSKYNEVLAGRVRGLLAVTGQKMEEKAMFGGLCFMVNDKMCVGVESNRMMVRMHPDKTDEALEKEGCRPMDFTGRVMKGYVFVDAGVLKSKKQLQYWLGLALAYNPLAKPSRPKRK